MINNVKVLPVINFENEHQDQPSGQERCYKASFKEITHENLLLVIVLPLTVPDNILHWVSSQSA
jgi:hypothetical protein